MNIYLVEIQFAGVTKRFLFINETMVDIVKNISEDPKFYGNGEIESLTFKRADVPTGSKLLIRL